MALGWALGMACSCVSCWAGRAECDPPIIRTPPPPLNVPEDFPTEATRHQDADSGD